MKNVPRIIAAKLLLLFSLILGCQTIIEMTRPESDKDAAISKAVKETFLKDKAVDLTDVNVRTLTDQSYCAELCRHWRRENMLSNSRGKWLVFRRWSIILRSKSS